MLRWAQPWCWKPLVVISRGMGLGRFSRGSDQSPLSLLLISPGLQLWGWGDTGSPSDYGPS